MNRLQTKKIGKNWWIVGDDDGPFGPYSNRAEALDDLKGLKVFYKNRNDKEFFTCEGELKDEL